MGVERMIYRGREYDVVDTDDLPFGNACNRCAFQGTPCYDLLDFTCHSDSRPDGRDVIFGEVLSGELAI